MELAAENNPQKLTARDWRLALFVALVAGALRVAFADQRGFWLDEYYTLRAAGMSIPDLIQDRLQAGHSPLHFLYAKLFLLLGTEERILRLSSALAVSATVIFLTGLTASLGLKKYLPTLWIMAAVQPYWMTIGTEFRYMMPLMAVSTAAAWGAANFNHASNLRNGFLLALLIGLMFWIHGSAQFFVFGLFCFLFPSIRGWRVPALAISTVKQTWPVLTGFALSLPLVWLLRGYIIDKDRDFVDPLGNAKDLCEVVFGNFRLWPKFFGIMPFPFFLICALTLIAAIFLCRHELLMRRNAIAWRMILCLIVGIPVAVMISSMFIVNTQGPERYVAAFSMPGLMALAIAWHAEARRSRIIAYRVLVSAILVIQIAGAAMDRGHRHREAVEWVIAHQENAAVIVSTGTVNAFAFRYLGLRPENLIAWPPKDARQSKSNDSGEHADPQTKLTLADFMFGTDRGFIFLYHNRMPIESALEMLREEKFVADYRIFKLGKKITILPYARNGAELVWLRALEPPYPLWGPASGD